MNTGAVKKRRSCTFTIIHHNKRIESLSPPAFKLYYILRTYSNDKYKYVFPGIKSLAARMNCSEKSIHRYLDEIQNSELIIIKKGKGNQNIYHFDKTFLSISQDKSVLLSTDTGVPYNNTNLNKNSKQQHITLEPQTKPSENKPVVAVETNNCKNTISNETPVKQPDENYKNNYINDLVIKYKDYQAKRVSSNFKKS